MSRRLRLALARALLRLPRLALRLAEPRPSDPYEERHSKLLDRLDSTIDRERDNGKGGRRS